MSLSFSWKFLIDGIGTRLTQHIRAKGPQLDEYLGIFEGMEDGVPKQMARLRGELNSLAEGA